MKIKKIFFIIALLIGGGTVRNCFFLLAGTNLICEKLIRCYTILPVGEPKREVYLPVFLYIA